MSEWLRDELRRSLGPTRAPEGLWERIQSARQPENQPHLHWARWAAAAIITVATVAGSYWLPGPQLRADVRLVPGVVEADSRPDHPAEWDLRCTLPGSRSVFRVSNLSAQRGHPFALAVAGPTDEVGGCQACHSMGLKEHHL